MKNYYTETIGEYILRRVQTSIMLTTLIILSLTYISMVIHSKELEEFKKTHFTNISVEREKSVKEQFVADIKKMSVPQELLQEETTVVIEKENEAETVITEETYAQEKTHQITTTKEITTLEEIPQVTTSKDAYSKSDVELLAKLMYAEEGIYIYKLSQAEAKYVCQLAGSVVLHRKNMEYGGADTIKEVIYANGQYECVNNGSINQKVPDIVYEWAEELLTNGPLGPSNMVYQAQFEQGEVYEQIGNQYFCLLEV